MSNKISWFKYQLGEKWFLFSALFILVGIFCWSRYDFGGKYTAIGLFIISGILGIYGGIVEWLQYKNDRTS